MKRMMEEEVKQQVAQRLAALEGWSWEQAVRFQLSKGYYKEAKEIHKIYKQAGYVRQDRKGGFMNWEETVMSKEEFKEWCKKHSYFKNGICYKASSCSICERQAQAEISFKAGWEKGWRGGIDYSFVPDSWNRGTLYL